MFQTKIYTLYKIRVTKINEKLFIVLRCTISRGKIRSYKSNIESNNNTSNTVSRIKTCFEEDYLYETLSTLLEIIFGVTQIEHYYFSTLQTVSSSPNFCN